MRPLGLDPEDPAVKNAVLGVQVTEWMEGPIGAYVMDRVRRRLEVLETSLRSIDPFKEPGQISKVQAEILHWEGFAAWLGNAIQDGVNAQNILAYEADEATDGTEDPS
jgi:hypothetical protein